MQDALRRYAEDVRHATGIVLQVRVGLDSGDVVVRSIGSDLRMDYSTVGQTTNVMEAVHRYSGTVNQVMGDGIMADAGLVRLAGVAGGSCPVGRARLYVGADQT